MFEEPFYLTKTEAEYCLLIAGIIAEAGRGTDIAVLISLYEYAEKIGFKKLQDQIREVFDLQINDLADRFKSLGLDDSLVKPSYVINTGYLQGKIQEKKKENPELTYHEDNEAFLENLKKEFTLLIGEKVT